MVFGKMRLEVGEGWELNMINFVSIIFNLLQIWDVHVCTHASCNYSTVYLCMYVAYHSELCFLT